MDGEKIEYCHRSLPDGRELYFLSNQKDCLQRFEAEFRVSGLTPELWNPVTGEILRPASWEHKYATGTTAVSIELHPNESVFVVFSKDTGKLADVKMPLAEMPADITPWTVSFLNDNLHRGPSAPITMPTLTDLSESLNDSIRYYSGTATYSATLHIKELPKGQIVYLDLGNVQKMAKVWVNGQYVGGAWTAPYRLPLSEGALRKGKNLLRIEVAGTWWNRLVGDSRLPKADRRLKTYTNQAGPKSPLQSYGLIGPVRLMAPKR